MRQNFRSTALGLWLLASLPLTSFASNELSAPFIEHTESVVTTQHTARVGDRDRPYRARAGRLPIRDLATGEIHGWMFYVAYELERSPGDPPRPVTFLWGGGPGGPGVPMDLGYFGPKAWHDGTLIDNPASLLGVTDLVFIDAIGTGFSRATLPKFEQEFYSVRGDAASFAEFIREWYVLYGNAGAPIYVGGASYGSWRAGVVTELLEKSGRHVKGTMLISGGILVGQDLLSPQEKAAYRVPAQAATAFSYHRLDPSVGDNINDVIAKATTWARETYVPALARIKQLRADERDTIARDLSRFTGYPLDKIDRKILAFSQPDYRHHLLADGRVLDMMDMRRTTSSLDPPEVGQRTTRYVRETLGYRSELAYEGLEQGYSPQTGPAYAGPDGRWQYDTGQENKAAPSPLNDGLGPSKGEPWMLRSVALDDQLRVFVASGWFDSMNTCAGNEASMRAIGPERARHFEVHCYFNGHRMAVDPANIAKVAADVRAFMAAP